MDLYIGGGGGELKPEYPENSPNNLSEFSISYWKWELNSDPLVMMG